MQMPVSDPRHPYCPPTAPEAAPGCIGDMADTPRDAGLKQAPAPRNEKAPADFGYVGIDSILEQMRRKAMKQGFEFNIMVVGESAPHAGTLHRGLWGSVSSSENQGGCMQSAGRIALSESRGGRSGRAPGARQLGPPIPTLGSMPMTLVSRRGLPVTA